MGDLKESPSRISFKSVDNEMPFEDAQGKRAAGLGNSKHLCCSLPDMNIYEAANECKGLEMGNCCMDEEVSRTANAESLEMKKDRKHKVLSSYYIHFKKYNTNRFIEENRLFGDNVATALEEFCESCETRVGGKTQNPENKDIQDGKDSGEGTLKTCWLGSAELGKTRDKTEDEVLFIGMGKNLAEPIFEPTAKDPKDAEQVERRTLPMLDGHGTDEPTAEGNAPTENRFLASLAQSKNTSFKTSPKGVSTNVGCQSEDEIVYERHLTEKESFRRLTTDDEKLLGASIEKEFRSELEFSTILTLAYVRVRDLTNSIDKANEFLASLDMNDDIEDVDELRAKIQTLFDNRADLALEREKWRAEFTDHFRRRKNVLTNLTSKAHNAEQSYFNLKKELLELEREPIVSKPKRSFFARIFGFAKK